MKSVKGLVGVVTTIFVVSLIALVFCSITSMQQKTEENCFQYLDEATHRLAADLYKTTDMDRTILTAMASIIANDTAADEKALGAVLQSYGSVSSYVNYTELLRQDNTMLDADGSVRDVSGTLDFAAESAKGAYVSDIEYSSKDPSVRIIRNAVPVVRDGKTIYMLYGVVVLSEFSKAYTTNLYDGNVYVYLVDGKTGDFMLDTWHNSFGNISDFENREMRSKETFLDAAVKMRDGLDGDLSFVSHSTGDLLYLHYEPVGINSWSVIVTVQEQYAMADSDAVNKIMYRMATIAGILILGYMVFIVALLVHAYHAIRKIGLNDMVTGLPNRNAFDAFVKKNEEKTFEALSCVYVDVNGLHELNNQKGHEAGDRMLKSVADALKSVFAGDTVFRVGGDEFVVLQENADEKSAREKAENTSSLLAAQGYHIACGVSVRQQVIGCEDVIHDADEKMLENKKQYYATHDRRVR